MFKFGKQSCDCLDTCDIRIGAIASKVLELGFMDFSVVEGRRSKETQNLYFKTGKSRVEWPDSKHNVKDEEQKDLAEAFDAVPYISGKGSSYSICSCCYLAGLMLSEAAKLGIQLRWGGNWDMDGEVMTDQDFQDLVHYELVK